MVGRALARETGAQDTGPATVMFQRWAYVDGDEYSDRGGACCALRWLDSIDGA